MTTTKYGFEHKGHKIRQRGTDAADLLFVVSVGGEVVFKSTSLTECRKAIDEACE